MNSIAEALVYAVVFIGRRPTTENENLDADVLALESIASSLRSATEEELNELAIAAERALHEELATTSPQLDLVESYRCWMENLLDGWVGNQRQSLLSQISNPPR